MESRITYYKFGAWLALGLILSGCTPAARPVRIAVGGKSALRFFPVYLAEKLGAFQAEGLTVTIDDLAGSARAMQALQGGSADVAAGFYDQTINMLAEGRPVTSFFTITQHLGFVALVSPVAARPIKSIADLKGLRVGVAAPGSSGHILLNGLLARAGLKPDEVIIQSIGTGAQSVIALERGLIDVGMVADLVVVEINRRHGSAVILADTRTSAGIHAALGVDDYPGSVLYAQPAWIARHQDEATRIAKAMQRTLEWVRAHSATEVAAKLEGVYGVGDQTVLVEALATTIAILSPDGRMPAAAPEAVRQALGISNEKVRSPSLRLEDSFTNRFVERTQ